MHTSSRIQQLLAASVAILLLATPVLAGSGKGPTARQGSGKGTQTHDRLRDGSCQDAMEQQREEQLLTGDLLRTLLRDQLRDPDQERDRLHDGSCLNG